MQHNDKMFPYVSMSFMANFLVDAWQKVREELKVGNKQRLAEESWRIVGLEIGYHAPLQRSEGEGRSYAVMLGELEGQSTLGNNKILSDLFFSKLLEEFRNELENSGEGDFTDRILLPFVRCHLEFLRTFSTASEGLTCVKECGAHYQNHKVNINSGVCSDIPCRS